MIKDPYHPTLEDIREWAFSGEMYPDDDWDLMVFGGNWDEALGHLVLELAADPACPAQSSFLHFLHVMTGSVLRFAVRDGLDDDKRAKLERLVALAADQAPSPVADWAAKTRAVMAQPETFCYEDWFGG